MSALSILPMATPDTQEGTYSASTCGAQITELEDQIQNAVDSLKVVHFIESNTTAFKSLNQKYTLYWLNTTYRWSSDISTCSAKLYGITSSFQLANSTVPCIGVAHISVNPAMTKVTDVQVDMPNFGVTNK